MTPIEELEKRAEIEMACLGVAEHLGWWLAWFAAFTAYLSWDSWLIAGGVLVAIYVLATYPYRKREDAASDAYHRAAGLGKYYQPSKIQDAA